MPTAVAVVGEDIVVAMPLDGSLVVGHERAGRSSNRDAKRRAGRCQCSINAEFTPWGRCFDNQLTDHAANWSAGMGLPM